MITEIASHSIDGYFQDLKCSPDGTFALTAHDEDNVSLYQISLAQQDNSISKCAEWNASSQVYAMKWYPFMHASEASTVCLLVSHKGSPTRLLSPSYTDNGFYTRATYAVFDDQNERLFCPYSVEFALDGQYFYGGENQRIVKFNIHEQKEAADVWRTSPNRKSKDGQKGIISTLSACPQGSSMMAAGSFNGSMGVYDVTSGSLIWFCDNGLGDESINSARGITQVQFTKDSKYVICGARNSSHICVWDIRHTGLPLCSLPRSALTNQRMWFDCSVSNKVVCGNDNGSINVYDLNDEIKDGLLSARESINLHSDVVSSAQILPNEEHILSCCGQRSFFEDSEDDEEPMKGNAPKNTLKLSKIC